MTLVLPPNYGQLALRFGLGGDPGVMISTVGIGNGIVQLTQPFIDGLVDGFAATVAVPLMRENWTFLGGSARIGQDGPAIVLEAPRNIPSTSTDQALPQNCAMIVRKLSALGGRRGRGRMFLPAAFLAEGQVSSNGTLASGVAAQMTGAMNTWRTDSSDLFVLLHSTPPAIVPPPTKVVTFVTDPVIGTQRRRLR